MNDELKKQIEALDSRRAQILQILCEDERVYHPEILLRLIHEIRSITKILKILRKSDDIKFGTY